jgi:hypothetical protein
MHIHSKSFTYCGSLDSEISVYYVRLLIRGLRHEFAQSRTQVEIVLMQECIRVLMKVVEEFCVICARSSVCIL